MCLLLCYDPHTYGMPTVAPMEAVYLVILSKLCLLQNRISKIELIQIVPIPKSCDVIKTITVCARSPMRHVSSHLGFTRLIFTVPGYS